MQLQTTNVVCMCDFKTTLNLKKIAQQNWNTVYNWKRFSGLIWQHRNIERKCLLFKSGKIICSGSSGQLARRSIRQYARLLQKKMGYSIFSIRIKKITTSMSCSLGQRLNLDNVSKYTSNALYEPTLYNGLIISRGQTKLICFSSGKIMITGVKNNMDITNKILPTLLEIKCI